MSYSVAQTAAILSSGLTVAAAGSDTVTENFANGDYSVFENGALITQKSVNADGSYDIAHFDVSGLGYSSYEDIYNASGAHVAEAQDMTSGSGTLRMRTRRSPRTGTKARSSRTRPASGKVPERRHRRDRGHCGDHRDADAGSDRESDDTACDADSGDRRERDVDRGAGAGAGERQDQPSASHGRQRHRCRHRGALRDADGRPDCEPFVDSSCERG